jgi:hypothetical protein
VDSTPSTRHTGRALTAAATIAALTLTAVAGWWALAAFALGALAVLGIYTTDQEPS